MGIIREFRDLLAGFAAPDNFLGFAGSVPSSAGVTVTEMSALQSSSIVGCIRIISGLLASLPLNVYEITPSGRRVSFDHPLQYLLNSQPNPETDSYMFKETLQMHLLLNGNCYMEMVYNNGGQIAALYQRSPFSTRPDRNTSGELIFKTLDGIRVGGERIIPAANVVHIKGLSMDGLLGMNPIRTFAKEVIGVDLASRQFGAKLFANNASPSAIVTTDKILKEDKRKALETSWISGHTGPNAHKFAVLDGGLKWQSISLSPEESQFLQTRGFQRNEIAAIYGVPPHLLGDREDTRANIEQQMLQFLNFTLKPWLKRWEAALSMKLLPKTGRAAGRYEIHFDTSEMERGDFKTMLDSIAVGRQWGIYTANEGRALLRQNPYDASSDDAADQLWQPVNMQVAHDANEPPAQQEGQNQDQSEEKDVARAIDSYSRVFRDAFGRVLTRNNPDSKAFTRTFAPSLFGICDLLYICTDQDFRSGSEIPAEVVAFVTDYMGAMQKRAKDWTAESANSELERAVRAIKTAVTREIAQRSIQ